SSRRSWPFWSSPRCSGKSPGRLPATAERPTNKKGRPNRAALPCSGTSLEVPLRANALAQHFLLELLGHFLDILGRPAGDVHAQAQAHAGEHLLDFVQGFAAEVGG